MQVFPPSPIHLSLAGINLTRCTRCGVARGGRASGLESCPLDSPVPPMLARPPVYTHIHISIHALCCIKSSIHLKLIGFYIIHVAVCDRRLLIHRDHKHVKGKLLWQKTEKHFSVCVTVVMPQTFSSTFSALRRFYLPPTVTRSVINSFIWPQESVCEIQHPWA